jgi:hypothetical protein
MRPVRSLFKNRTGASKIVMHPRAIRAESKPSPHFAAIGAESASRAIPAGFLPSEMEIAAKATAASMIINEM